MFLSRRYLSRLPWFCGSDPSDFLSTPLILELEFEPRPVLFCDGARFTVFDVLSETVGVEIHGSEPSRLMWMRFDPTRLAANGSADCTMLTDGNVVCGRLRKK